MSRLKFSLTSDQLELLLAFEEASSLSELAEKRARDPSVVSRNLQKMAEEFPVLEKIRGRWQLTSLGLQINDLSRDYLEKHSHLLAKKRTQPSSPFTKDSVLLIINAQKGLLDGEQKNRNNSEAENHIAQILNHWRAQNRPLIHIKHVSDNPGSRFYRNSSGCDFLETLAPKNNEPIVEKTKSSAFIETALETQLASETLSNLVLVGFTAHECIDATARDAASNGFSTFVVGDATATFDVRDASGKLMKADRVHQLTLTNINAFYAKVVRTAEVLL